MRAGGERRVQGAAAFALLFLLLAPVAMAADSVWFTTANPLELPGASTLGAAPEAIYLNDTRDLEALTLKAARVTVDVSSYSATFVGVGDNGAFVPPVGSSRRYVLHDLELSLLAAGVGWAGVYPGQGSRAEVATSSGASLEPETALQVGYAAMDQGDDGAPLQGTYGRTLAGPLLDVRVDGTLTFTGPGVLKLMGPDVLLAAENVTRIDTGVRVSGEEPIQRVNETWLTLTFEDAVLTLKHSRIQIAAPQAGVAWDGSVLVDGMRGELRTGDETYLATGQDATLDGSFRGLVEAQGSEDGAVVAAVQLEGALAFTSLAPASRSVSAPAPAWAPAGFGLLVAATVAAGVTGAFFASRRRARVAPPELTVEQFRDLADAAMENLRFADALEWLEKAQAIAPGSARLWMDKGYCHASLGDVPEALAAYARASSLSTDGEADLLAASLLLRSGEPDPEAAERHVERALERSPAMALEVQLDSTFDPLRGRPRFARALRRALGEREA